MVAKATLDGIILIRAAIAPERRDRLSCVRPTKTLLQVEPAFRDRRRHGRPMKTVDLRPCAERRALPTAGHVCRGSAEGEASVFFVRTEPGSARARALDPVGARAVLLGHGMPWFSYPTPV